MSHSDFKEETNSSTIACSLLLMSSMGGRSTCEFVNEIFDVCDTWDRPGNAVTLEPFSLFCHTHCNHKKLGMMSDMHIMDYEDKTWNIFEHVEAYSAGK